MKRICNTCLIEKDFIEFGNDPTCVGGIKHKCKVCVSAWQKQNYLKGATNHPVTVPETGKVCADCGELKLVGEFYRDKRCFDGVKSSCKPCQAAKSNAYRSSVSIKLRELHELKMKTDQVYRAKKRQESSDGRKKHIAKDNCRKKVQHLIFVGKVARGDCEVCGEPQADVHHPDYLKPFEIHWLCRRHHGAVHRKYSPLILTAPVTVIPQRRQHVHAQS